MLAGKLHGNSGDPICDQEWMEMADQWPVPVNIIGKTLLKKIANNPACFEILKI